LWINEVNFKVWLDKVVFDVLKDSITVFLLVLLESKTLVDSEIVDYHVNDWTRSREEDFVFV
jgi:hypothetical protein